MHKVTRHPIVRGYMKWRQKFLSYVSVTTHSSLKITITFLLAVCYHGLRERELGKGI